MELKEYVLHEKRDLLVWELVLKNGIALFDYKKIGCLARTNKFFGRLLHETRLERKKYMNKYCVCLNNTQYEHWERYNSIYGAIAFKNDDYARYIWFERQCLSNPMILSPFCLRDNFYSPLPHEPKPFFTKKGDLCFYGYGEIEDIFNEDSGAVVEYCFGSDQKLHISECVVDIKKEKPMFKLRIFLEFPPLLKALLASNLVYQEIVTDEEQKKNKVFSLEAIIVPKNYKLRKQYFSRLTIYPSFDALPEIVRKKIVVLYEKQRLKRRIEKGLGCFT